jgi:hypothetical protein
MHETRQAAAGAPLPASSRRSKARWWIRHAPQPDVPHRRDRAGVQKGFALAIAGATVFWLIVGLGVLELVRHG